MNILWTYLLHLVDGWLLKVWPCSFSVWPRGEQKRFPENYAECIENYTSSYVFFPSEQVCLESRD